MGAVHAHEDYGYIGELDSEGKMVRHKVDKGMLDMTDRENLSFRYAL